MIKDISNCSSISISDDVIVIDTDYDYCILNNKQIMKIETAYYDDKGTIKEANKCFSELKEGIYVFNENNKEIDLANGDMKNGGINGDCYVEKYVMYVCSNSTCRKTSGYIKIDKFFKKLNEMPSNWENECNNYFAFSTTNNKFERVNLFENDTCLQFWNNKSCYEIKYGVFYFINKTNKINLPANGDVICGVGHEGNLFVTEDKSGLCLGVTSTNKTPVEIEFKDKDDTEYYLTRSASGSGFSVELGKAIILKRTKNIIYHNNLPNDGKYISIIILFHIVY